MLVTILYRFAGEPPAGGYASFSDVQPGEWYSDAILWAVENGIANGYSNGEFGVDDPVTREQIVTILYRYADAIGIDVSATATATATAVTVAGLSGFTDIGDISDWALDAMKWAVAAGIMQGRTQTTAAPQNEATRAEVATIIMRFTEIILM